MLADNAAAADHRKADFTGRALAMASPGSTAEVSALVKLCAAHAVPIVPQGGNSGMCGGATPDEEGHALLLSMRRMNAIEWIDAENLTACVQAGIVGSRLEELLGAQGFTSGHEPDSMELSTLGGWIAFGYAPDGWTVLGIALIAVCGVLGVRAR